MIASLLSIRQKESRRQDNALLSFIEIPNDFKLEIPSEYDGPITAYSGIWIGSAVGPDLQGGSNGSPRMYLPRQNNNVGLLV